MPSSEPLRRPIDAADRAGEQRLPAHGPADQRGRSWYQGIRFAAQHRTTPLILTASHIYSKSEDRLNHWFSPENSTDPESDRGPTGADTPHNLVTSITWNIPGRGPIFSDWQLSTVTHSQSGAPYSIRYAGDPVGYSVV